MTPTFDELQAARRREVAARRREITKASREAKGLPSPTAHHRLNIRPSDEPLDVPPAPRKADLPLLQHELDLRAALTPAEVELLDAVQDVARRRADLKLFPKPGAEPPPLPGTPEARTALRERLVEVERELSEAHASGVREKRRQNVARARESLSPEQRFRWARRAAQRAALANDRDVAADLEGLI